MVLTAGCSSPRPSEPLFGRPTDKTGLSADDCRPWCGDCDGGAGWTPPDDAAIDALISGWTHTEPFAPITENPYAGTVLDPNASQGVCAVLPLGDAPPRPYRLVSYPDAESARAQGAVVTHFGACGVCSTLENLAVYLRYNDLGGPVRDCGLRSGKNGQTDFEADLECLRGLGFDLPCAQIWAWNTSNTRDRCLSPCFFNLTAAYNLPDGRLNECLQCDEEKSGPVFKQVAGRTRRNSGIPNAICRPCAEVQPLEHQY